MVFTFLKVLEYVSYIALVSALAACGLRRWGLVMTIGRAISVASLGLFFAVVLLGGLSPQLVSSVADADADPSQKARILAESISFMLNCGTFFGLMAILGTVLWVFAPLAPSASLCRSQLKAGT